MSLSPPKLPAIFRSSSSGLAPHPTCSLSLARWRCIGCRDGGIGWRRATSLVWLVTSSLSRCRIMMMVDVPRPFRFCRGSDAPCPRTCIHHHQYCRERICSFLVFGCDIYHPMMLVSYAIPLPLRLAHVMWIVFRGERGSKD